MKHVNRRPLHLQYTHLDQTTADNDPGEEEAEGDVPLDVADVANLCEGEEARPLNQGPVDLHLRSWDLYYSSDRLKGQCHEIFASGFFHESPSPPQAPAIYIRIISNFFENSRRYSQVKVKFATGFNDTGGKFCHQFPFCC